ncbi:MAG TPA: dTDP-4-dehydrorhamnose 3,5-epimerase family protein [Acidimicrobiales bacterium]|jgi:dTDP-4-dehydrorhamnose 3,5-epimerase|nr:dTDP-4-dehydrorhamnose 3,5-epimerase family protein [Acidimicrobiales bacterium]
MIFRPTRVEGVYVIDVERDADERGWFARTYDPSQFAAVGLTWEIAQCSLSFNQSAGTLRGMHYQQAPYGEPKLVRCTNGRIFDVALDLRPRSATFRSWVGEVLTAERANALFVPPGCAHGFLTLEDASEVFYSIGARFVPSSARGVRWNDPAFGISWPRPPTVMSERDATYPDFVL